MTNEFTKELIDCINNGELKFKKEILGDNNG